jgi:hypothetical protein
MQMTMSFVMQNAWSSRQMKQHQLDTHLMGASGDLLPDLHTASSKQVDRLHNACVHASVPLERTCLPQQLRKSSQPRPPARWTCLSGLKYWHLE